MFLLRLTATIYLIKTDVSDGFVISGDVQFVRQLNMNQHHANAIPNYNCKFKKKACYLIVPPTDWTVALMG